jgi:hypothetical protein
MKSNRVHHRQGGIYVKKWTYLIAIFISLTINISVIPLAVGVEPADLSGSFHPTYYPPGYSYPDSGLHKPTDSLYPIDDSHDQKNTQEQVQNTQGKIQVTFSIIGESNEPIPGAQLNCRDGAGNSINQHGLAVILDTPAGQRDNPASAITDDHGNVTITGFPGNWQFSVYKSGFYSNTLIYPFTHSTSTVLMLQETDPLETLNLNGHEDKKEFTTIKITMPAFCSNITTEQESNPTADQPAYTGDEG